MKQVVIEIPDDKEVQWIDNVLTLVDKEPEVEIKSYQDLIDNNYPVNGYYIDDNSVITKIEGNFMFSDDRNIAASEKVAKSMLAMAMISQLMPYYGGEVTNEEWENSGTDKYIIRALGNKINIDLYTTRTHYFLAFHTEELRDEFLKNNERLVKDYLMLD